MKYAMTIEVGNLSQTYADVRAIDGISFSVRRVELFSLLEPNGAGKTTTINSLTGLARPDGLTIDICSVDKRCACSHNPEVGRC